MKEGKSRRGPGRRWAAAVVLLLSAPRGAGAQDAERPPAERRAAQVALEAAYEARDRRSFDDARAGVRRCLELAGADGALPDREACDLVWFAAELAYALGLLEESRDGWARCAEGYERLLPEGHEDLLMTLQNLGVVTRELGDADGARGIQERVVETLRRTSDEDDVRLYKALGSLATTLSELGEAAAARALQEQVLDGFERLLPDDDALVLAARGNLATTHFRMGDYATALVLEEAVLAGFERTLPADHPSVLLARLNLALTTWRVGDAGAARRQLESVVAAFSASRFPEHGDLEVARGALGSLLSETADHAEGIALLRANVAGLAARLPAASPKLATARLMLARGLARAADPEALVQARRIIEDLRELPAERLELMEARRLALSFLCRRGDSEEVRELHRELVGGLTLFLTQARSAAPREARSWCARVESFVDLLLLSASDEQRLADVVGLLETRRCVASTGPLRGAEGDGARLADLRRRVARCRDEVNGLAEASASSPEEVEAWRQALARAVLRRDRALAEVRSALVAGGAFVGAVEVPAVAEALAEDAAAVGFHRYGALRVEEGTGRLSSGGESFLAALVLPDGTVRRVELGPASAIEELVHGWRAALGKPVERSLAPARGDDEDRECAAGDRLRAAVLDPVLALLPAGTRVLHACLDDVLHTVPVDALPLAPRAGAERLRDRYAVVGEVSFERLLRARPAPAGEPSLLAVGGVSFDAEDGGRPAEGAAEVPGEGRAAALAPLLQTRFEAQSVVALFEEWRGDGARTLLLTRADATEAAFRARAPEQRYLHVATHGWFAPERPAPPADPAGGGAELLLDPQELVSGVAPMTLCGLAFAGANRGRDALGRLPGVLTAEELAGIDLSRCELAVLSACETNVGIRRAGQGVESLQAALHAAGARTAVTSLWKVDDAVTRRLMELFYTYLWEHGAPKAEALWRAKCDLRREGAPVRDWGGWVLSGDPR